MKYLFQECWS